MVYLNRPNKFSNQNLIRRDSLIVCNFATQNVLVESNVNNEICERIKIHQPKVQKASISIQPNNNLELNKICS